MESLNGQRSPPPSKQLGNALQQHGSLNGSFNGSFLGQNNGVGNPNEESFNIMASMLDETNDKVGSSKKDPVDASQGNTGLNFLPELGKQESTLFPTSLFGQNNAGGKTEEEPVVKPVEPITGGDVTLVTKPSAIK